MRLLSALFTGWMFRPMCTVALISAPLCCLSYSILERRKLASTRYFLLIDLLQMQTLENRREPRR